MAINKESELQKYLEKKRKQKTRDELMKKIVELSTLNDNKSASLIKKKIKRKKIENDDFDQKLFLETEENTELNHISNDLNENKAIFINEADLIDPEPIKETDLIDQNTNISENKTLLNLNESFKISKLLNRAESIINQREKLEIFYEEVDIISKIKSNLITFIQGETGCGKTTQIPQFLYENGFCFDKMIAVTQPRRFSAISISNRINFEANENISGYKIKYENNIYSNTKIKILTEGVLFKEIQSDFLLKQYSVVVLDEIHERSTNMDILIGLLSKIIKIRFEQNNPLRLVLMSATTDPSHFKAVLGNFELIKLTGKMFPINMFFEPSTPNDYIDTAYKKILAILQSEKKYITNKNIKNGDILVPNNIENNYKASILVFLTSKEDIYTLKSRLDDLKKPLVVLPLHSGLKKSEQSKVYETFPERKIILATNIAETSITINDIVFVIDCGLEKIKVIDQNVVLYKTKYICKSSAKQRMGRAGRTGPGVCYRLYSGDTFELFSDHNLPQILMEPFDSNLLQLKCMGIKNVFGFPFIDQPSKTAIEESLAVLESFDAIDHNGNITSIGKKMCRFPIKTRYSRFLVMNQNCSTRLFNLFTIIVSILSSDIELKKQENTKEYFIDAKSDLIVLLRIYIAYSCSNNKKIFMNLINISIEKFDEINKMTDYLLKISNVEHINPTELTRSEEEEICRSLYYLFADQLAVNVGNEYISNTDNVFISNDSIVTDNKNVVFDYIVCGYKKAYLKNITVVPF